MSRVSVSGDYKTIEEVWKWYECVRELSNEKKAQLLSDIESGNVSSDPDFLGMTIDEIEEFFKELDYATMLNLLAAAEATIRIDYLDRVSRRKKDAVSRRFRDIHRQKGQRAALSKDILAAWKDYGQATKQYVGDFNGALKLRHWLAHGRYWSPKLGKDYVPDDVYEITWNLLQRMGLITAA